MWDDAADRAEALVELMDPFRAAEGTAPAGRTPGLPGMGSLLLPPWTLTKYGPTACEMTGHFTRFHVGGNMAVHGGVLPLLFDHMFGMVSHAAGRPISRTAFLHVDYRKITPIDAPLAAAGTGHQDRGPQGVRVRGTGRRGRDGAGRGQRPDGAVAARPAVSEPTRPRVMLLGSGEPSRELTTALRRLGAEVIAVADADPAGVSAELARLEPDFVVTVTDSISDETLAAVEAIEAIFAGTDDEFTELVPSARSVRLTADREGLRRLAADELGLPTAPFWFVGSVGELKDVAADAGFPLLLKPAAAGQPQSSRGPTTSSSPGISRWGRRLSGCWPKLWSTSNSRSACSRCARTARPVR